MNRNNKVVPLHMENTIDDQASIWLVRLDNGNLSEQSRKELKVWLSVDKRHQVALKAMADVWDGMDEVLLNLDDKNLSEKTLLWPVLEPMLKPLALAASVSFLAVFLWFAMPNDVQKNSELVHGSSQKFILTGFGLISLDTIDTN